MEETYSLNDFDRMRSKKPFGSISKSKDGNYAAVGIYRESGVAGEMQGAVYVFLRSGATWTQQAKLLDNNPNACDGFGHLVIIGDNGGYAVIGDTMGAVILFKRIGAAWRQLLKIRGSQAQDIDYWDLAVEGY